MLSVSRSACFQAFEPVLPALLTARPAANLSFQLKCGCGYAKSLTVGLVTKNGKEYASKLTLTCSDGSVVRDPVTTVGPVRNVNTPVVRLAAV